MSIYLLVGDNRRNIKRDSVAIYFKLSLVCVMNIAANKAPFPRRPRDEFVSIFLAVLAAASVVHSSKSPGTGRSSSSPRCSMQRAGQTIHSASNTSLTAGYVSKAKRFYPMLA